MVAVALGAGGQVHQIGAGAGLAETLAPELVARSNGGQIPRLLRGRAEGVDYRPDQADALYGKRWRSCT